MGDTIANGTTAMATFGDSGNGTVTINGGFQLQGITFTGNASAYTFSPLTPFYLLMSPDSTIQTTGSGLNDQIFETSIALTGGLSFSNNYDTNVLRVTQSVFSWANGNHTLSLKGSNTGANLIGGPIVNAYGSISIVKEGAGSWILEGDNTYTGTTEINEGVLLVTGTHSFGGGYTINGGYLGGAGGKITTDSIAIGDAPNSGLDISGSGISAQEALLESGTLELALGTGSLDLALAGEKSLRFALTSPDTSDRVFISSGTLGLGDGVIDLATFQFDVSQWDQSEGTYFLFTTDSPGGIVGSLATTGLEGILDGHYVSLIQTVDDEGNAAVAINIAIPEPSGIAGMTALAMAAWLGARRKLKNPAGGLRS